jgi:hypothetical protein
MPCYLSQCHCLLPSFLTAVFPLFSIQQCIVLMYMTMLIASQVGELGHVVRKSMNTAVLTNEKSSGVSQPSGPHKQDRFPVLTLQVTNPVPVTLMILNADAVHSGQCSTRGLRSSKPSCYFEHLNRKRYSMEAIQCVTVCQEVKGNIANSSVSKIALPT